MKPNHNYSEQVRYEAREQVMFVGKLRLESKPIASDKALPLRLFSCTFKKRTFTEMLPRWSEFCFQPIEKILFKEILKF